MGIAKLTSFSFNGTVIFISLFMRLSYSTRVHFRLFLFWSR